MIELKPPKIIGIRNDGKKILVWRKGKRTSTQGATEDYSRWQCSDGNKVFFITHNAHEALMWCQNGWVPPAAKLNLKT